MDGFFREDTPDWAALFRTASSATAWLPAAGAEDAAQEAMLRAWRAWSSSTRPSNPSAWMIVIARREALRWKAGPNGRSWSSTTADLPERADAAQDEPLARVELHGALARLPSRDRALLLLRYQADLPQREIARLTGTAEGNVRVRLHRARRKLRHHLS